MGAEEGVVVTKDHAEEDFSHDAADLLPKIRT
jgi:hypothetical protein